MPTTLEALIVIGIVVAPGYLLTRFAVAVIAFEESDGDLRFLLPTITAGTTLHALMWWWTVRIIDYYEGDVLRSNVWEALFWALVMLLVLPVFAGITIGWLANTGPIDRILSLVGMGYLQRMPSSGEYVMRLRRPGYLRFT